MKRLHKQSKFIKQGKVAPVLPDCQFSNVDLKLLVGKFVSCKTNEVRKHLLIADYLGTKGTPFYSEIVYSNSVGDDGEA
jgi:hypothetical protein